MKTRLANVCLLAFVVATASDAAAADGTPGRPEEKVTIVLVGDSTVTTNAGWGAGFEQCLNDKADCINTARGGSTTMTFRQEGHWTNALALQGDYYLIQFGHNHEPAKPGEDADMPAFVTDIEQYVDDTLGIGAQPVLVTPLSRRQWDKANPGQIKSSLEPYAGEMRRIAVEKDVPLVELHDRSKALYETFGREKCLEFSPLKTVNGRTKADHTHLNEQGGVIFGWIVAEELARAVPKLARCIKPNPPTTSPTR
jgi:pectinesterase